jgi:hypothetical protein
MPEHEEQCALFHWAKMMEGQYPEMALLHAVPNHNILLSKLGEKHRFAVLGYMHAEGLKDGVLDVHLPVARCGYHSLWIEMKYGKNDTTPEQRQWLDWLAEQGNFATVCRGAEDAIAVISDYLSGRL